MRYKYIAYKYTRRTGGEAFNPWDSFRTWSHPATIVWRPPTDVYETRDKLIILIELAGVDEEDMTVTLFSDLLVVEGTRLQPVAASMNACHQLGIKYGEFRSEVHVPYTVDTTTVKAEYKNGVLTVTLDKLV